LFIPRLLLLTPEVLIGLVDPILAGWGKDVYVDGILKSYGAMWNVGRNQEPLARADRKLFAVDRKLKRTRLNMRYLFVDVTMHWDNASLFEQNTSHHHVFAHHELALKQRAKRFSRYSVPNHVLQLR